MPPVLIPVALTAVVATAGVAMGYVAVGAAVLAVGATAVSSGVGYLSAEKAKEESAADASSPGSVSASQANAQRDIPIRQAVPPRRYVYGECRIGGVVFFQDNANPYLYIGLLLSDGVVDSVQKVFFGDTEIPMDSAGAASIGSIYYQVFSLEFADGDPDESASATLTAAFSDLGSTFRQQGVARAVLTLKWANEPNSGDLASSNSHQALWGDGVTPTLIVRGVKTYDPRDIYSVITDEGTWSYSSNPALAVAHALTHVWDLSLSANDLDWDSFADCADACDALMTYNSTSVRTFEIAGMIQSGADLASQLTLMLASFGGVLVDVNGKIGCIMDGERSSVWTITDDDILEFGEYVASNAHANTFNAIKAKFFDVDSNGEETTTPVYELTYAQATEGLRETSIDAPFVAKSHSAQILAFRELMRSRAGRRLTITVHDAGLYLQALDRVTLASTDASFVNGDYEVVQVDLAQFGAILQLREYPTAAYADPSTYLV